MFDMFKGRKNKNFALLGQIPLRREELMMFQDLVFVCFIFDSRTFPQYVERRPSGDVVAARFH